MASAITVACMAMTACDRSEQTGFTPGEPSEPGCRLDTSTCDARFPDGGLVRFAINPLPIPPMAPLQLRAEVEGVEAERLTVRLSGVDMNMGPNEVELLSAGGGVFTGQATVPVCIRDSMDWQARVRLETGNGAYETAFFFRVYSGR